MNGVLRAIMLLPTSKFVVFVDFHAVACSND